MFIIYSMSQFVVWSVKCQKMVRNVVCFPKHHGDGLNCLNVSKDIQFTLANIQSADFNKMPGNSAANAGTTLNI